MAQVQHATLVADTVTTKTFTSGLPTVEVYNIEADADLVYFTVDGVAPTVGGTNCYVVGPASALEVDEESGGSTITVKLISSGTPTVSVTNKS